jgi:hypothetical protein
MSLSFMSGYAFGAVDKASCADQACRGQPRRSFDITLRQQGVREVSRQFRIDSLQNAAYAFAKRLISKQNIAKSREPPLFSAASLDRDRICDCDRTTRTGGVRDRVPAGTCYGSDTF